MRTLKPLFAAAASAALLCSASAGAQEGRGYDMGTSILYEVDTPTFLLMASSANQFEIQSSMLASEMATDPDVTAFAEAMVEDHTRLGEAFEAAVQEAGLAMPVENLVNRHRAMVQTLQTATGRSFDPAYSQMQFQVHREAVNLFEKYAESGDDEILKAFAAEVLPILERHFVAARQLPGVPIDATGSVDIDPVGPTD